MLLPFVVGVVAISQSAPAQATAATVAVHGVAYDSLRRRPLADAFIGIAGDARTTTTDARGRFRFDGVAPGTYTFTLQHAAVDSVGFTGLSSLAVITDGRAEVRIAVPSFATLWRVTCGPGRVPNDSGFVYGTIRDAARREPAASAAVELTWVELGADKVLGIRQRWWRGQTVADARGGYAICGVPVNVGLRLRASVDSSVSGLIDLPAGTLRVQRRDLLVGPVSETDSTHRGVIDGRVTMTGGSALADARVIADGVPEVRTSADGRFRIHDVPSGTRQVEILAIGMMPVIAAVDVVPHDTSTLTAELRKVTTLDVVRVTAPAARRQIVEEFAERRKNGFGYLRDSSEVGGRGTLAGVFREFPSVQVERGAAFNDMFITLPMGAGRCLATLWIDGQEQRGFGDDPASFYDRLNALRPGDLAAVEVYPRAMTTPFKFMGTNPLCGAVVVWTKWAFGR